MTLAERIDIGPPAAQARQYDVHGVRLAVSAEPDLLDALDRRLRVFRTVRSDSIDLTYEFCRLPDGGEHVVQRPPQVARSLCDLPWGALVYADAEDDLYVEFGDHVRARCDLQRGLVRVSIRTEVRNLWLLANPLLSLTLNELLKRRGLYSVHAAGVCVDGRGLLMAGSSGSGKSTLALALARAGLGFMGDDTMYVTTGPEGVRVHAFPDEVDLTDRTADLLPELRYLLELPRRPGWPKRQVRAEEVYGAELVSACRPSVLVFPRVAHTETSAVSSMSRGEALLALTPNVLLTDAGSTQAHLDALAALINACDCYRLDTGRDFDALPVLLGSLLR